LQDFSANGPVFRNFTASLLQEFGPLLTVKQAARVVGLSPASIYKLCSTGKLAHKRILNAVRIPAEALARLIVGPNES
jgi:excisionase family DNA binding protein